MQTDCCVEATTRGASGLGYSVTLVADGHSTAASGGLTAIEIIADRNLSLAEVAVVKPAVEIAWT
jgi:nicotinamidase-related amidase